MSKTESFLHWKAEQISKDGGRIHPKQWYWSQYGNYCNNVRRGKSTIEGIDAENPAPLHRKR